MQQDQQDTLEALVQRVVFRSPDNGYCVLILQVGKEQAVTACGHLPDVREGQRVSATGTWTFHQKFGRQFQIDTCIAQLPVTSTGIAKYLGSGLIKGIGPKFAEKVVQAFGEKTLEIIENDPERLYAVPGLGHRRVDSIIKSWQEQKEIARVVVFLREKDVSTSFAVKIFKTYGNKAIDVLNENPYRLVDDIWGVGFKTADKIACQLGLGKQALSRIAAGVLYTISAATDQGHLYVSIDQLKTDAIKVLELEEASEAPDLLRSALTQLYQQEKIKLLTHQDKHFVSLPQYYFSEIGIANKLKKMLTSKPPHAQRLKLDDLYDAARVPDARGVLLNEDQQRGIMSCMQERLTIVTGGPGTGKTTLVKRLIQLMGHSRIAFRLAAPTGRAAKRMFESTGTHAETIHRLLEFAPQNMGFARNEQNALELDVLILDEASMIDVFLMHSLLRAMPSHAALVLLGDIDQLPSVGAGNVLNDLIASGVVPVVRLTHIFRQAQDSMIIVNAHRVNQGEFPSTTLPGAKKDFSFVKQEEPEEFFPLLRRLYTGMLQANGISPENAVVLVPMNKGVVGTTRINQELQLILNPEHSGKAQIMQFGQIFRVGDRVMQLRNNYDKFVFNGDMGRIEKIDHENQVVQIIFGQQVQDYDFAELNELTLAYAISIHKSQGSEFDAVIAPFFMQHFVLLQRNLVYTAITRAKRLCVMVGQPKAIGMAVRNNKTVVRQTFLKQFLTSDLQAR